MKITSAEYEKLGQANSNWKDVFNARCAFWPELVVETSGTHKKWFVASPDTYEAMCQRNFWVLSRQYYALAWSLFTLGHPNQILMPYRDNG